MASANKPSGNAYDKLVGAAANAEGKDAETYKKELKDRGAKTLQAVSVSAEKGDVERRAKGLAIDAIEEWDKRRSEAALEKKAAKKGISVEQLQEQESKKSKVEKALSKIASLPGAILFSVPNSIKRSRTLRRYRNIAEQAINDNGGNLAAGAIAIELDESNVDSKRRPKPYNEAVKQQVAERLANGEGNDFAETLLGRASAAIEAGEDNEDTGVKIKSSELSFASIRQKEKEGKELTREEKRLQAIAEYTAKIAGIDTKGEKSESADQAAEDAKKAFLQKMSELDGGNRSNNYSQIADTLSRSLKGVLHDDLYVDPSEKKNKDKQEKAEQRQEAALSAIDRFLDDTVSVGEATVSTGLAAKETCAKLQDNAILKWGVVIGTGVSLGATFATAVSKNAAVHALAGTNLAGLVTRTVLAAGIGGIRAGVKEGQMQRRENVKRALGMEDGTEDDTGEHIEAGQNKKGKENQFSILSAEKIAQTMQELAEGLNNANGEDDLSKAQYDRAVRIIAEIKLRNKLQNANEIQLIGYSGRDDIERQKLEMFRSINELKKAMREAFPERAKELDGEINEQMQEHEFNKEFNEVKAAQRGERLRAAGKGALIAGFSAFAVSGLMHATGFGAAAASLSDNPDMNVPEGTGSGLPDSTIDPDKFVESASIEGLDANGDGIIDASDFADRDLTSDSDYEQLKDLFEQKGISLEREEIDVSQYGETTVGNYLENAENAVDNSGGVDWGKSANLVGFGNPSVAVGDGMDSYEVPVWGLNGGEIPDGAKLYIDFDGDNGPGQALEFTIEDGKAIVPADVLDTSNAGNGGAASFIGTVRVGEMDGNTMVSYATAFGEKADLSTPISAVSEGPGFAFTATDAATGERISQFAVNASNQEISNLSEIFNGVPVGDSDRLPFTFAVNDIDSSTEVTTLASGSEVPDLDYSGGYHAELDSFENTPFIEGKSYLGTPIQWDLDGDGIMNPEEEATYFKQILVRTGTNPNMLGQNASNYGLLEPDRLESIIPRDTLISWGIEDGVVDSETDLNILLDNLKLPENADYYDSLVNNTINEMESVMQGGSFEVDTINDRISTFANSNRDFDTSRASTARTIIYPKDANGNPVGNKGWWCRKYGAEGGRVGDMPLCEQKGISKITTPTAPTSSPASATIAPEQAPSAPASPTSTPVAPAAPVTPTDDSTITPTSDPVVPSDEPITPSNDSTTPTYDPTQQDDRPEVPEQPDATPEPKNQMEANENSGANDGIVRPESQTRELTEEPQADPDHAYNPDTNTYNYTPDEQAGTINYEVDNDIRQVGQESSQVVEPEQQAAAEEAVSNQTAPEMVPGTSQGAAGESGQANNFDAGATVGTGEVSGGTESADGSGRTIQENLSTATGVEGTDYSEGF